MEYKVYSASSPLSSSIEQKMIAEGEIALPDIAPREAGTAKMNVPDNFFSVIY